MKFLFTSVSIAIAASGLAAAAPTAPQAPRAETSISRDARLELARRFVSLSQASGNMMDDIRTGAMLALSATSNGQDASAKGAAQRRVDLMLARAEPTFRKRMPEVLEAYANAHAREFSAAELVQMIAFAQTPAGKHYVSQIGFLEMDRSVLDAQELLASELAPIMQEVAKELCAERAAQRIAAGDTKAKCPLSAKDDTLQG